MTTRFTLEAFEAYRSVIETAIAQALAFAVEEAGADLRMVSWFTAAEAINSEVDAALKAPVAVEESA